MSDPSPGPGWWLASDGQWYPPAGDVPAAAVPSTAPVPSAAPVASAAPPAPSAPGAPAGAADGSAPEPAGTSPGAPTPAPAAHPPGWWLASDGNWYPPAEDGATPAAAAPATADPATSDATAASNRRVLLAIGAVAVVVLLVVGGLFVKRTFGGKLADNAIPLGIDEPPSADLRLADGAVVVRSNGGAAVKEISPDGTRLVLDAGADGADRLQPGNTLVLTGVTSVKADKVERQGGDIVVTAKPATLPDVIRDGRIRIDHQEVDLSKATMRIYAPTPDLAEQEGAAPALGEGDTAGEHLDAAGPLPAITEGEQAGAYLDLPLAQAGGGSVSRSGTLGGYDYRFDARIAGGTVTFTLHLARDDHGIKTDIDVNAEVSGISFDGDIEISAASIRSFRLDAPNLAGHATITASATADSNATRIPITLVHVPMSIQVPFPIAGIPFTVGLDADAKVELAFSSRDATVTGSFDARYSGNGGLHVDNGSLQASGAFDINWEDPLANMQGASVTPASLLVTIEFPKLSLGLGISRLRASAYLTSTFAFAPTISGVTNFTPCRAMPVSMRVNAGITAEFLGHEIPVVDREIVNRNAAPFDPPVRVCQI